MGKILNMLPSNENEQRKQFLENFEKDKAENNFNMERVSRELLINMGEEDNRSKFDQMCDKKETKRFKDDLDDLINKVMSNPTD